MSSESLDDSQLAEVPFHGQSLEPLFREISAYQQLLDDGNLSEEDRIAFTNSVDKRWPYMNKNITVSGNVYVPKYADEDATVPEMVAIYVDEVSVESLGFSSMIMDRDDDGNEIRKIGHCFVMPYELIAERALERQFKIANGFAVPDSIVVTYPFTDSWEENARLYYHFEETLADIDEAFIQSDNECEVIAALGAIEFVLRLDDVAEELDLMKKYINKELALDTRVPYIMEFEGFCYELNEEGTMRAANAEPGKSLAYALGIETLNNYEINPDNPSLEQVVVSFGLRIETVAGDKDHDTDACMQYIVPITDTFSIRAVRPLLKAYLLGGDSSSE